MTTPTTTALFSGLFDDAALFPPGDAPMAAAVPAHRQLHARLGALAGPFVVPAARLDELSAHLGDGAPISVSVISAVGDLPTAVAEVAGHGRLTLAGVEVPVPADASAAEQVVRVLHEVLPRTVPAFVEVPRTSAEAVLDVLAGTGTRAKLRTGGLHADRFPSPQELASTLAACLERGLAFKCTAGLHHAVRHTDAATGFEHHGFLNVLGAVSALADGASPACAAEHLRSTDAGAVVAALRTWTPQHAAHVRASFTSFGTCSVLEPVDDLVALGLLALPERSTA